MWMRYLTCFLLIVSLANLRIQDGYRSVEAVGVPSGEPSGQPSAAPTTSCSSCAVGEHFHPDYNDCRSCSPGLYCEGACTSAVACPAGSFNPGYSASNLADCFACPAGYISPMSGSTNCTACPPGYACPESSNLPVLCGNGTYSVGISTYCTDCPSGSYTITEGSTECIPCPSGSFGYTTVGGSNTCDWCPAGYSCPHPSLLMKCPAGYFSSAGSTNCSACPTAHSCPFPENDPVPCTVGSYSIGGQESCTPCPVGHYCPSTSSATIVPCQMGTYSIGNQASCTVCPAGYECPYTSSSIEVACAAGSYSTGGSQNCTLCPAGFACDTTGSVIEECEEGHYSSQGDSDCHMCPVGNACPDKTIAAYFACEEGTYSLGNQTYCTECPPGYACPSTSSSILLPCSSGTFSIGSQAACTTCPAGYACPSTTTNALFSCSEGYYAVGGASSCTKCTAGSYCPSTLSAPIACSTGTYSADGATVCTVCPAGYSCFSTSSSPTSCSVGFYSVGGATDCTLCSPGFMCRNGLNTNPTPGGAECPIGGYCNPANVYTPCPVGMYGTIEAGQSLDHACTACEAGYVCNSTGLIKSQRVICPAGSYCPEGSTANVPCPTGTYSTRVGQTSPESCTLCPAGTYCVSGGSTSGAPCEPGYFCPVGTTSYLNFPCPAGKWSSIGGLHSAEQCAECTAGHYCPAGSSYPHDCPTGTYQPSTGSTSLASCLPCPEGYACNRPAMHMMTTPCAAGHYCPYSTEYASQYPCPSGTYSDSTSLVHENSCLQCPAGYACGLGTTSTSLTDCPAGHYCSGGSQVGGETACPLGTYSNRTNLQDAAQCVVCPPGYFCASAAMAISGACAAGYYCPSGTYSQTQHPCPTGTYSNASDLYDPTQCTDCPPGSYCEGGLSFAVACPAGYYSSVSKTVSADACSICPAGYSCAQGSATPLECGVGYYSDTMASVCLICPVGHYCGSNTSTLNNVMSGGMSWVNSADSAGVCFNGTYCPQGMIRAPDLERDACPAGSYCPAGVAIPQPCPAGSYSSATGQDDLLDCITTSPGYYTISGSTSVTGLCSPGYYCPAGSTGPNQVACPSRYYRPEYGGASLDDCSLCVAGGYCPANSEVPTVCPQGYYCVSGVSVPEPCSAGSYGNSSGLRREEDCQRCDAGYYCDGLGLTAPRGLCDPGFYCLSGSNSSAPYGSGSAFTLSSSTVGGVCPRGSYCPLGSGLPVPCPVGTFNNRTGATASSDCVDCTPGYFCEGLGNTQPTGTCSEGYYCDGGASTPTQHGSVPGYYSPSGSSNTAPCVAGTYSGKFLAAECENCPAGYYCPSINMTSYDQYICNLGHYCPEGTSNPLQCPPGTYSAGLGNTKLADCLACPPGAYCAEPGLDAISGYCEAGYYCSSGAEVSVHAVITATGGPCPVGHYCPTGTGSPIPCPRGSIMPSTMAAGNVTYQGKLFFCDPCPAGSSCSETGLESSDGPCNAGYFCKIGAGSPTPYCDYAFCENMYGACPVGHHCDENTIDPVPCEDGHYMNHTGASNCDICPAGYYCDASYSRTSYRECPQGSYCLEGTGSAVNACPRGKYGSRTNLQSADDCSPCDAGQHCSSDGLLEPSGNCSAGFYCPEGSMSSYGETTYAKNHTCPVGSYCPQGSALPYPCPPGTFNPNEGMRLLEHCLDCSPGSFCEHYNMSTTSGLCSEGYYCVRGSSVANPTEVETSPISGADVGGSWCPPGTYCPEGSAQPLPCLAGTFNNLAQQKSCFECPQGYFCPGNTSDFSTTNHHCPQGYYCPNGTKYETEHPCPAGTFNNLTLRTSLADCVSSPPGYYTSGSGNAYVTGQCMSGYYCPGGATTSAPECASEFCFTGGKCSAGYECSEGTSYPSPCSPGFYCANSSGLVTGPCDAGYYCTERSTSPRPLGLTVANGTVVADICPPGSYCSAKSIVPIACGTGYFSATSGNTNASYCFDCTAGYYCPEAMTITPIDCPEGYYCPLGTSYFSKMCDEGNFCPLASPSPQQCPPGTYQSYVGQSNCTLCPEGYFCPESTAHPIPCPTGYYCLDGTQYSEQYPCPAGTYNNKTQKAHASSCVPCSGGTYCEGQGNSLPTGPCSAGYFCGVGASVAQPHDSDGNHVSYSGETCVDVSDNSTNDICPPGHYCPAGSPAPVQCPPGTNTSSLGQSSVGECQACVKGYYCPLNGTVLATRQCLAGYYCPSGTSNPADFDNLVCPSGHHCPVGVDYPIPCPAGTYQDERGNDTCKACPTGSYCEVNTTTPEDCPPGHYCPSMTEHGTEFPCPNGTYSNVSRLGAVSECQQCTPGMYCGRTGLTNPSGLCDAGAVCYGGDVKATGVVCPSGRYCPEGTYSPVTCPAGTSTLAVGLQEEGDCGACPKGFYCPINGTDSSPILCTAGYYCPTGTTNPVGYDNLNCPTGSKCPEGSDLPVPCTGGTYQNERGNDTCKACPVGSYCEVNTTTPEDCPPGHYCPSMTEYGTKHACPNGTYSNVSRLGAVSECQQCTPGMYCGTAGLLEPTSVCSAGYFCGVGASVAQPHDSDGNHVSYSGETCVDVSDNSTNDICPPGHYCPAGSPAPVQCPPGTNTSSLGLSSVGECQACVKGYYCPLNGTVLATRQCLAGYYCPSGTSNPADFDNLVCPSGHHCPVGVDYPIPCPAGTYQDERGNDTCKACPAGSYCEVNTTTPEDCPPGYYCPSMTEHGTEFPCPNGTYSNVSRLGAVSECQQCTPGMYCGTVGLLEPTSVCSAGYFCGVGASVAQPHDSDGNHVSYSGDTCVDVSDNSTNDICPPGHYCPAGSPAPVQCPPGTNTSSLGLSSVGECQACVKGYYCPLNGTVLATRQCLAGYYCPSGTSNPADFDNLVCPSGHHCPVGVDYPIPCPAGTYQDERGNDTCKACPAGSYCEVNTTTPEDCPPGHYCPSMTEHGTEFPCPNGTYSNVSRLGAVSECQQCTPGMYCGTVGLLEPTSVCSAGYFCGVGASVAQPRDSDGNHVSYSGETCVDVSDNSTNDICPPGHYCPAGSPAPVQCPPGTNTSSLGLSSVGECQACVKGYYCPLNGTVLATRQCLAGYYCPSGTSNPADFDNLVCPSGHHCPVGVDYPIPCPTGTYQDERGNDTCKACPAGSYCEVNTTTPEDCPPGYYCPSMTEHGTEFPCPNGTYSNVSRLGAVSECHQCTPGMYCGTVGLLEPTSVCSAGYFCGVGASVAQPHDSDGNHVSYSGDTCVDVSDNSTNDICPPGHYCPAGSPAPVQCPPGTNTSSLGLSSVGECQACVKGYYCPLNGTVLATRQCLAGYYCPSGTSNPADFDNLVCPSGHHCPVGVDYPIPCPAGTYQDERGNDTCKACPAGSYCEGNTTTPEDCPPGHYCPSMTEHGTEFPCPNGTYSNVSRLGAVSECQQCTPGMYCGTVGLLEPTSVCSAGYFCGVGASVAQPHDSDGNHVSYSGDTCVDVSDNSTNDICPPGHYCPAGSPAPVQCPPGTNTSSLGLSSVGECQACVKGYYCPLNGTVLATRQCLAGYYCPSGTSNPADFDNLVCPSGHHCPVGVDYPIPCPAGTYQDERGNDTCKACPAGSYCEGNTTTPEDCPPGHYCPSMTEHGTEFPCPNGTYSNVSRLGAVSECHQCTPGMYCGMAGLLEPTSVCSAGYFCGVGASVAQPHDSDGNHVSYSGETCVDASDNSTNDICPPGHYCPAGSPAPVQCPPGTNTSSLGLSSVGECQACVKGYYCPLNGTVLATRQCLAGYYCPSGTSNPADFDNLVCPSGHHCPVGVDYPIPCPAGTYQDERGNDTCKACPAGSYCEGNTTTPEDCPPGHYCPSMTEHGTEFPCPNGTYSNVSRLGAVSECQQCTPGMYCGTVGLLEPTSVCSAGYFCGVGASVAQPHDSDGNHVSYSGETCVDVSDNSTNDICPPGHYCPAGSLAPVQCPPGTNTSSLGLSSVGECQACVKGYYCPLNGTVLATRQCLAGYYCPSGTSNPADFDNLVCPSGHHCPVGVDYPIPCPAGTYQDERGNDTCKACPAGSYCEGNTTTPEDCPPGHYCPSMTEHGTEFPCPNGTYSNVSRLGAVSECQQCTPGMYCGTVGLLEPTSVCSAGYFCGVGASVAQPHDSDGNHVSYSGETCVDVSDNSTNDICPPGHYCPAGSLAPVQCPPGTNTSSLGLSSVGECQACVKGYYCPLNGTVLATRQCLAGYYCPSGTSNPADFDNLVCPSGHHCPVGVDYPIPCPAGTYQDERGNDTCKACPAGSYCEGNTTTPEDCPPGYYCPSMTEHGTEFPCPNGTYSNVSRLGAVSECHQCTPGMYCGTVGLLEPTSVCSAGYFCGVGASVAQPHDSDGNHVSYSGETCVDVSDNSTNDICPPGHYCPAGSPAPVQCPPGTNTSSLGLSSVGECQACVKGYYCPLNGTVLATRQCLAGYYCPSGTSNPADFDNLVCPSGHHCPVGVDYPIPCPAGTYQDERGNDTCKACPAGSYCKVNTTTPEDCPHGYFCSEGTEHATQFPCPSGTFQNMSGQVACSVCLSGMYCPHAGMIFPELCRPGYYCPSGASNYSHTPCPRGSFSSEGGLKLASECSNVCLRLLDSTACWHINP